MRVVVIDAAARCDAVRVGLDAGLDIVDVPGTPVRRPLDHTWGYSGDPAAPIAAVRAARPDAVLVRSLAGLGVEVAEGLLADGVPVVVLIEDAWWLCEQRIMRRPAGSWCGQRAIDPLVCSTCVVDHREHEDRQRRSAAVLRGAASVVVPGRFWVEQVLAAGVAPERIVRCGPLAVAPDAGPSRVPWAGPVRFGFLGTDAADAVEDLIAAFAGLRRTDFEFRASGERRAGDGRLVLSRRDFPRAFLVRESGLTGAGYCAGLGVLVVPAAWPGASAAAAATALGGGVHLLATRSGPVAELITEQPELAARCTLVPPGPAGLRAGVEELLDHGVPDSPDAVPVAGQPAVRVVEAALWAAAQPDSAL